MSTEPSTASLDEAGMGSPDNREAAEIMRAPDDAPDNAVEIVKLYKTYRSGNGQADKTQVARMVGVILGHGSDLPTDATDALAVAIAHALGLKKRQFAAEDGTR